MDNKRKTIGLFTIFKKMVIITVLLVNISCIVVRADVIQQVTITDLNVPANNKIFLPGDTFSFSFQLQNANNRPSSISLSGEDIYYNNGTLAQRGANGIIYLWFYENHWVSALPDCFNANSLHVTEDGNKYSVSVEVKSGNTVKLVLHSFRVEINGSSIYGKLPLPVNTYAFSEKCIAGNHTYYSTSTKTVDKSPTCGEPGSKSIKCVICGAVVPETVESIPARGHSYGPWSIVKRASYQSDGLAKRICSSDRSHVETKIIYAIEAVTPPQVKATAEKNTVTVSWAKYANNRKTKKLLSQIKKIQVQCATDKSFKTIVADKKLRKNVTKCILKLKKKKTYFVRVRYAGKNEIFSKWSKTMKVKTK